MARFASFSPFNTQGTPGAGGLTLDALMLRQKELARNATKLPAAQEMASPWQGAAYLANTLGDVVNKNRADRDTAATRAELAKITSGVNYDTGATSEQINQIAQYDPEMAARLMADRQAVLNREDTQTFTAGQNQLNRDADAAKPLTDTGKLSADLAAGRITQEQYDTAMKGGPAKLTDVSSLRQDVISDPSYKNMAAATPIWSTIKDAATRNDPQSDLNIVIGMAKLFDPTSVVREGEVETVKKTGSLPANLFAQYQYLTANEQSRLDPAVKAGLLREGASRMRGYYDAYQPVASFYKNIATQRNINPNEVVYEFANPVEEEPPQQQVDPKAVPPEFVGTELEKNEAINEQSITDTMNANPGMTRQQVVDAVKKKYGIQ